MKLAQQPVETLNVAAILAVADAIEHHTVKDVGFNMHVVCSAKEEPNDFKDFSDQHCGTVACIAGWTLLINGHTVETMTDRISSVNLMGDAAGILGLRWSVQTKLFMPNRNKIEEIDDKQAVRTLRHLAETGIVDFEIGANLPSPA